MSHGEELALREDTTSRRSFDIALRGYDKRQVDHYASQVESEISALSAERKRGYAQIQDLAAQVHHLQVELTELHQRPPQIDRASFRHLGPMVDQILALAEKQAESITNTTAQRAADHQAEAEKVLVEARERAAQTLRDLEAEIAARRANEEKGYEERLAAAQAELAEVRELADKLRADGEAAHEHAKQEAERINELSSQQVEDAKAEAEALVEAARVQVQQEVEAARAQAQQGLAQWKANVEREIGERRTVAEREMARLRTLAEQKSAALHAEAQQYSADLRRNADKQAAAHQQQLTVVQQEIQARRQALAQLQAELDTAQQRLAQTRQEGATAEREGTQLQQRLGEVRQDLTAELNRLDEARRAGDSAERHAKEVRARVQREAKRVADLASAAVMAAAAGGAETGEYKMVTVRPPVNQPVGEATEPPAGQVEPPAAQVAEPTAGQVAEPRAGEVTAGEAAEPPVDGTPEPRAGEAAEPAADEVAEPRAGEAAEPTAGGATEPHAGEVAHDPAMPYGGSRHARHEADNFVPAQRAPQPGRVTVDAE